MILAQPCDQRGRVRDGVTDVEAVAAVIDDKAQARHVLKANRRKYPILGFFIGLRQGRKIETGETVSLRISPAAG